ncbi:MAG: pseudouridine-5'-phosphate glycosidase, partial [Candidatus Limnocylindria bacterium]|nr:pseudouridine-5'-phosphate glycosidase [Candidatus Limnocylindria bacterium]
MIAHGLPRPMNLDTARLLEQEVREFGATPATIALAEGAAVVGADEALLERLASAHDVAKVSLRDLAPVLARRGLGGTTVASTVEIAARVGIAVMATGGIGGVHRGAAVSFDVSSDIDELAATRVAVVCSGPKSILDLAATLELLETRRVPVIGLGVDELPAFFSPDSGLRVPHRVETPLEAAQVIG